MNVVEIIEKKKEKIELCKEEIEFLINGFVSGEIADYQMSAFAMAVYFNSMTKKEIFYLTNAMKNSGDTIDLSDLGVTCDKHSSGGVSDTTTIAIAPIVASLGVKMLKMSGRGLGHTGGTIDKLEAFSGYNADLSINEAKKLTIQNGAVIISQSLDLCPADKKLYALRDVTATIDSIPLIASSIMSKKLASGTDVIVLDVKCGNGAFMKNEKDAKKLAELMVEIGKMAGKKICAFVTDMNMPLGYGIGDELEVREAIQVLQGKNNRLSELVKILSSKIVTLANNITLVQATQKVNEVIRNGIALQKLKDMIKASGGSLDLFEENEKTPITTIYALNDGYVQKMETQNLGMLAGELGAGRQKLGDVIKQDVGLMTLCKIGDKIKKGDPICEIYAQQQPTQEFLNNLSACFTISKRKTKTPKLILAQIV